MLSIIVVVFAVLWFISREPDVVTPVVITNDMLLWEKKGRLVEVAEGIKVFVVETWNEGSVGNETLLIFHGFPTSSLEWENAIKRFGNRFKRIVIHDHVGFGFSSKPKSELFKYSIQDHADVSLKIFKIFNVEGNAHFLW